MRAFCLTTSGLTAALFTAGLTLTGCGSATVDSEDVTGTGTATATATATESATATTTVAGTATSTSKTSSPGSTVALPADRPASEVESVPNPGPVYTAQEQAYLQQLKENGLNIEGVEDQLTATGATVCGNDVITRDAVAGQLVEQRRTDMTPEALGALIEDAARGNLCS